MPNWKCCHSPSILAQASGLFLLSFELRSSSTFPDCVSFRFARLVIGLSHVVPCGVFHVYL